MTEDELMARLYWRLKRKPLEGTASAAIIVHSQACGLIAHLFDVSPDDVARAVKLFRHKLGPDGAAT